MSVWIAQCICPNRHAILASSGEADDRNDAETLRQDLKKTVDEYLRQQILNPWCGICHAPLQKWAYELGETRFASMKDATPALLAVEAANIVSGVLVGELLGAKPVGHA